MKALILDIKETSIFRTVEMDDNSRNIEDRIIKLCKLCTNENVLWYLPPNCKHLMCSYCLAFTKSCPQCRISFSGGEFRRVIIDIGLCEKKDVSVKGGQSISIDYDIDNFTHEFYVKKMATRHPEMFHKESHDSDSSVEIIEQAEEEVLTFYHKTDLPLTTRGSDNPRLWVPLVRQTARRGRPFRGGHRGAETGTRATSVDQLFFCFVSKKFCRFSFLLVST